MADDDSSFKGNFDGVVKFRGGEKAPGDGYDVGDRPFADEHYEQLEAQDNDARSTRSSHSRATRGMGDRDRYEPSQYGERGYVARDGYARDGYSDAYERGGGYAPNDRGGYRGDVVQYSGGRGYDRRRSYDDQDVDYVQRTRVTRYNRDNDRGLDVYRGDDRERARSQDYRREERTGSRGRRDDSDDEEGGENTQVKKWAATFAGAAVGGIAANRFQKGQDNWVPTAVGAVIGGLLGREVEKKVYEHKEHKERQERRREKQYEDRY